MRVLLRFERQRIDGRFENVWVAHPERSALASIELLPEEKARWCLDAWLSVGWHLIGATDNTVLLERIS